MRISNTVKSYFKFLAVLIGIITLLNVGNAFLSNALEPMVLPEQTGIFLKRRMEGFLKVVPTLMGSGTDLCFFWGASEIENGMDTSVVDPVLETSEIKCRSVNVGMRSVHPAVYTEFAEKVEITLGGDTQKIAVSFVKIPWNRLTRQYAATGHLDATYDQLAVAMPADDLKFLWSQPLLYFRALLQHHLFNNASSGVVSALTEKTMRRLVTHPESDLEKYFSVWSDKIFMETEPWSVANHGSYRWNLPASKESLRLRLREKKDFQVRESSYDYFEKCCGMKRAKGDDALIATFAEQVQALQRISKKVVLYSIPEEKGFERVKSPKFEAAQIELFLKISLATGLTVFDISDQVVLNDDDYMDFLHLSESGQTKFYKVLFGKINLPAAH